MSKRMSSALVSVFMAAFVVLAGSASARADESADTSFKLKGPIDAVSCSTTPPTVTVFGLVVDLTGAVFDVSGEKEGDDDKLTASSGDCSSLSQGNSVELTLTGDAIPLAATKVEAGESEDRAEILGPIQVPVDTTNHTLTLFGLTIDASQAANEGDDDDGQPAGPVDLTLLSQGQFVEVKLDDSKLPALVASEIEVKNFTNQVSVDVDDEHGQEVNDDSDSVDVSVDQTVVVAVTAKGKNGVVRTRHVRRTFHQQLRTNGHFVLTGLAKGPVTIKATRVSDGRTTAGRRVVVVHKNKTTRALLRLHVTRTR